jgi:hypothetical protein
VLLAVLALGLVAAVLRAAEEPTATGEVPTPAEERVGASR